MVDVPVASLQLLYQGAFGDCLATQKPVWTHVVGKRAKQNRIRPEPAEHGDKLPQVFTQERVRLPFRHGACRIPFARLQLMTPAYIGIATLVMPALKVAGTQKCSFHKRQAVDCRLPVRSLLAAALCGHGTDRHKRTEHHHEYTHHLGRGL